MDIKISVIVPVYNTENYLNRCLESLINQSLKEIEIILVNDCSTDNSQDILEKYKMNYSEKIVALNLEEQVGPGGARNEGIRIAKGEYLGFVDSDDDVLPGMFEELYGIAHKMSADIVDCQFYHEAFNANMSTTHESALGELNLLKRRELFIHSGFIWSKIIRRSIIIDNNIKFREKAAYEDIDFIRIVLLYCHNIYASNSVLYNYRNNSTSITNSLNPMAQIYQKMEAIKFLVEKYKYLGAYKDYKDEFIYFIYKTYVIMVNFAVTLKKEDMNPNIFKELHDFFFGLVDYNYQFNRYISQIPDEDRMAAEINNEDYTRLFSICFE